MNIDRCKARDTINMLDVSLHRNCFHYDNEKQYQERFCHGIADFENNFEIFLQSI